MVEYKLILYIFMTIFQVSLSKKYYNYTLYRAIPVNDYQLGFFQNLTEKYDVNFWRAPGLLHRPIEFMISPKDQSALIKNALENHLYLTTVLEDVQSAFDNQTTKSYIRRRTDSFDWQNYYRVNDIYNWLRDLAQSHSKVMTLKSIGRSHENRDILAVKIVLEPSKNTSPMKKVFIEGGIHAREWISVAFVTYFLNELVNAPYSKNNDFKTIAYMYEWHIVPVLNPDGYEYTHTVDRMWRKNRHGNGVDINRNFGYAFGTVGVSSIEKSEIYCGPQPFSENEAKAMASYVKSENQGLAYYFAFHSFGQYMIIPYADAKAHKDNFDDVKLMGLLAAKKLSAKYGTIFTVGTAYDTVGYMTSGISGDWVKISYKVPVVCTFELRDGGRYGFALPSDQIKPTCLETTDAIISLVMPHEKGWKKGLSDTDLALYNGSRGKSLLDVFVIVCNVLFFIIVRFD